MNKARPRVALRDATSDDAELLFAWVNSADALRAKVATLTPIAWSTHTTWLAARLDDPNCVVQIIEYEGSPVGQLRLEPHAGALEVDIYVVPARRSLGIATTALSLAIAQHPRQCFRALVRHDNLASQALFRGLGFSELSQTRQLQLIELVQ